MVGKTTMDRKADVEERVMRYLVLEKPTSHEIMAEINKNAAGNWDLFSLTVTPFGNGLIYVAVMKAKVAGRV